MNEYVVNRCCGNCEWCISPENEKDIMIENHYDEDDLTRPRAGDCCLGCEHDNNYFCNNHSYISSGLNTYAFYDEKDLGPGYYVVSEYYDNIIRYFKLYRTGEYNNYNYGIRVYEINPITNDDILGISFDIEKADNQLLYKLFSIFAKALGDNVIINYDCNNYISTCDYNNGVQIKFSKVMNGKDLDNNYIDIVFECNREDRSYRLIEHLFRNLAAVTMNKKENIYIKKIRSISK